MITTVVRAVEKENEQQDSTEQRVYICLPKDTFKLAPGSMNGRSWVGERTLQAEGKVVGPYVIN